MIAIRPPESIFQIQGRIQNGTFSGRWHFSFDQYRDPAYTRFGALRVFNDDTLSPGAVWPLHPHREIEVVTYCAAGEFRHADEHGVGGLLKKGWVQHTTVGKGMYHSEINNSGVEPMRFIQMWFLPGRPGLDPAVQQKRVETAERTGRWLPLVSNVHPGALPIFSDARILASFLEEDKSLDYGLETGRGGYLYLLEGGPVSVNGFSLAALGAAKIEAENNIAVRAENSAELLLVDVLLS
jgi:quercetin 2,3-dioxygenase